MITIFILYEINKPNSTLGLSGEVSLSRLFLVETHPDTAESEWTLRTTERVAQLHTLRPGNYSYFCSRVAWKTPSASDSVLFVVTPESRRNLLEDSQSQQPHSQHLSVAILDWLVGKWLPKKMMGRNLDWRAGNKWSLLII